MAIAHADDPLPHHAVADNQNQPVRFRSTVSRKSGGLENSRDEVAADMSYRLCYGSHSLQSEFEQKKRFPTVVHSVAELETDFSRNSCSFS